MKVCFWSTTFQADNQALAHHLAGLDDFEVVVALDRPELYRAEAVNELLPFHGRMVDRRSWSASRGLRKESFDVLVVDNHLPAHRIAPRVFVLWHGFGWRVDDLAGMRAGLAKLVGDVTLPNRDFLWQAFGDWDRTYRIEHSRIAADNVRALGSAYSDLLLPTSPLHRIERSRFARAYTIDVATRPTILLGLTWHHGGALGHWGDDATLLGQLFAHAAARNASVLMRMHDRFRYPAGYAKAMERLVSPYPHVQLKWKSSSPDSLVDLIVSDVVISNYSSLLNACYYTGKPTLHVDPADASGSTSFRTLKRGKVRETALAAGASPWKLPPSEIGGLRVGSFPALLEGIDRALAEPDCCKPLARAFIDRYITGADGTTCKRIAETLRRW